MNNKNRGQEKKPSVLNLEKANIGNMTITRQKLINLQFGELTRISQAYSCCASQ